MKKRTGGLFTFEKIVSIKKIGKKQTYDFIVPGTNSFFANEILCHNSGGLEETSDGVILLYWPYNNEPNCTDRDRFEMNIEKQRHGPIGRIEVNFEPRFFRFSDRDKFATPKIQISTRKDIFDG